MRELTFKQIEQLCRERLLERGIEPWDCPAIQVALLRLEVEPFGILGEITDHLRELEATLNAAARWSPLEQRNILLDPPYGERPTKDLTLEEIGAKFLHNLWGRLDRFRNP